MAHNKTIPTTYLDLAPSIISVLLLDRTTGKNILWATSDYVQFGIKEKSHIKLEQVYGSNAEIYLVSRYHKHKEKQANRTRERAEVFTPSWICNEQNNLLDEEWFGKKKIFNTQDKENPHNWISNTRKITFKKNIESGKTWQDYINATRMEITCGEAPYLTSRYDTTNGKSIKLNSRIGLLDRKLRVVRENAQNESDFFTWCEKSFQNIYGFEMSGDNLIIARTNLLLTFIENTKAFLKRLPTEEEQLKIAEIISWNIWQMDGLNFKTPFGSKNETDQPSLFEEFNDKESFLCVIKDWKENKTIKYKSLMNKDR